MPTRPTSRLACAAAGLVLLLGSACTVADNLSADEMLTEIDAIVQPPDGQPLKYRKTAEVSSWYMRWFLLWPIRGALGFVFGGTHEEELENPTAHVRELMRELPDETGGDLITCAQAATRFAWVAEFEPNAQSRVVAIDGLTAVLQQLDESLFGGDLTRVGIVLEPARLATASAGVQLGRPEARGDTPLAGQRLQAYIDSLGELTSAPLEQPAKRVRLAELLTKLYAIEPDPQARAAAEAALRASLRFVAENALLRIVMGRDLDYVELRLCAMEQVRRLGGPRTVPLLLAVMAATPEQRSHGDDEFDGPLVQLRLIHYCGQIGGELADTSVPLLGRAPSWTPREFLARTALQDQSVYSKVRVPALLALTWSLRRPRLEPDDSWVQQWWDARGSAPTTAVQNP